MKRKKILIGAAVVLVGVPIAAMSMLYAYFYAVFYFPNRSSAVAGTLVSSGEEREYLLYLPTSYDRTKPTPLVITLHTSMSWPTSAMNISRWNAVAEREGFMVVYPAGTGHGPRSWNITRTETPSRTETRSMPDVVFISDLIDKLEASYNIDTTRIYANGMSNGGGMAFVLSCALSDRIAAVGMVSAGLYLDFDGLDAHFNGCARPVPVIAFHGTADPICPYDGNEQFLNVPRFMAQWAGRNRCTARPVATAAAPDVARLLYSDCADDASVVLYTIRGEGHQWPGGKAVRAQWMVGRYSDRIDATTQMWAFFRQHARPSM